MRRLAVFARSPVRGRVKSRLSPALPAPLAAALYAGLLRDALEAARVARVDERVVYWADELGPSPVGFSSWMQRGAELGERMHHCSAG